MPTTVANLMESGTSARMRASARITARTATTTAATAQPARAVWAFTPRPSTCRRGRGRGRGSAARAGPAGAAGQPPACPQHPPAARLRRPPWLPHSWLLLPPPPAHGRAGCCSGCVSSARAPYLAEHQVSIQAHAGRHAEGKVGHHPHNERCNDRGQGRGADHLLHLEPCGQRRALPMCVAGTAAGLGAGAGAGGGGAAAGAAQSRAAAPPARLMVPHARTCLAQDLGVHQQDVAHGQEGDHSRLDFRAYCAPPIADFEVAAAWARPGGAHAHRPTRHGRWVAQRKPGRLDTGSNGAAGAAPDTPLACAPGLCAAGTSMLATHLSRASLSPIAPAAALRGIDLGE